MGLADIDNKTRRVKCSKKIKSEIQQIRRYILQVGISQGGKNETEKYGMKPCYIVKGYYNINRSI